jgi:hypothetical protein
VFNSHRGPQVDELKDTQMIGRAGKVFRLIRVMRILRVFKVTVRVMVIRVRVRVMRILRVFKVTVRVRVMVMTTPPFQSSLDKDPNVAVMPFNCLCHLNVKGIIYQ